MKDNTRYQRSKSGLVAVMHRNQRAGSRARGHVMPNYTLKQLRRWVYGHCSFLCLYNRWVRSEYKNTLVPSIDRINDHLPYTLGNIRLTTWGLNRLKQHMRMKSGKIENNEVQIYQYTPDGKLVNKYKSISGAGRTLDINKSGISLCCNGKLKTAGGFIWSKKRFNALLFCEKKGG